MEILTELKAALRLASTRDDVFESVQDAQADAVAFLYRIDTLILSLVSQVNESNEPEDADAAEEEEDVGWATYPEAQFVADLKRAVRQFIDDES